MRETPLSRRHRSRPAAQPDPAAYAGQVDAASTLFFMAVAYTIFVIYGSLVPLHFQHHSWEAAWESFRNIRYLNLGIGSRADWVANILLFVPLAFAWLGVLWQAKSWGWRVLASIFVLLACIGLSIGIEFTQIFFPPRTVSQNDIVAETLGAILGIVLWWTTGSAVIRWYAAWQVAQGPLDFAQRLLYVYLFLLFGYNILPLDLTLSPVEIYHKWREGRVILIPFTDAPAQSVQALYGLATDILVWFPAGLLARLTGRLSTRQVWLRLTAAAALLEFLQLFVFTRVTDVTDILTGSLGVAIGTVVASRWRPDNKGNTNSSTGRHDGWLVIGIGLWLGLILAIFWYPFNFRTDGAFVRDQLADAATRIPFVTYYYGTEYRAVTEVFHKIGFFFPLGLLLALGSHRIPSSQFPWKAITLGAVAITAGVVETGQLFLPGKFPDLTDWILEAAGGWAGCALAWRLRSMSREKATPELPAPAGNAWRKFDRWPFVGGTVLGLTILFWAATHLSAVPYNVRELIAPEYPLLSALLFACALIWVFGFPAWFTGYAALIHPMPIRLPWFVFLHGFIAWTLVRLAVPLESIHDIVGSPVLGWPWEWELMGRFLALFAIWSTVSFGAALFSLRRCLPRAGEFILTWAAMAAILLPCAYFIVINQAATDNLTELLAGGGTPLAFLWVMLGLLVLAVAGSQLACAVGSALQVGVIKALVWGVASFPLTYLALHAGLEVIIVKYGRAFSAFQFLLSSDREHYATPLALVLRFVIAHASILLLIAVCQAPFLGWLLLTRANHTERPVRHKESHRKKRPDIRE